MPFPFSPAFLPPTALPSFLPPSPHTARSTKRPPTRIASPLPRARFPATPLRAAPSAAPRSAPRMRMGGGGRGSPPAPAAERLLASLPYLIPLLDSLSFGKFVFAKVPLLGSLVLGPLLPLYSIYRGIPFFAFGVFIVLFIFVVRNTSISRYIRFNTYQALILDIALIFPQLFQGVNTGGVIPGSVVEVCSTAVFYAISFAILYAVITNAKGQTPDEIPGVSASVYQQMGPF